MRLRLGYAAAAAVVAVAVEIAVFVVVAKVIGVPATLLLVLATSLAGAWVLRREGTRAWRRFQQARVAGGWPGERLGGGLAGLAGAVLLLLPGLVSDTVGLALLTPPGRRAAAAGARWAAQRRLPSPVAGQMFGPRRVRVRTGAPRRRDRGRPDGGATAVIEGEVIDR